jgi:adenylate cyclase, class 2
MGIEIEAKMKVADLEAVRQRLETLGAKPAGEHFEINTFFDTPANALRAADKGFRIRANRDASSGKTEHIVTFKGPRQAGELKSREEIEFTVDDSDAAIQVFAELGYRVSIRFEKRRRSWRFMDCKVELDELPDLGAFVEIEGPSHDAVIAARKVLGLAGESLISDSYASMIARKRA